MAQKLKSYWEGKNCTLEEMEKTINLSCVKNISPLNSVFAVAEMGQKENRLKEKGKSRAE